MQGNQTALYYSGTAVNVNKVAVCYFSSKTSIKYEHLLNTAAFIMTSWVLMLAAVQASIKYENESAVTTCVIQIQTSVYIYNALLLRLCKYMYNSD